MPNMDTRKGIMCNIEVWVHMYIPDSISEVQKKFRIHSVFAMNNTPGKRVQGMGLLLALDYTVPQRNGYCLTGSPTSFNPHITRSAEPIYPTTAKKYTSKNSLQYATGRLKNRLVFGWYSSTECQINSEQYSIISGTRSPSADLSLPGQTKLQLMVDAFLLVQFGQY